MRPRLPFALFLACLAASGISPLFSAAGSSTVYETVAGEDDVIRIVSDYKDKTGSLYVSLMNDLKVLSNGPLLLSDGYALNDLVIDFKGNTIFGNGFSGLQLGANPSPGAKLTILGGGGLVADFHTSDYYIWYPLGGAFRLDVSADISDLTISSCSIRPAVGVGMNASGGGAWFGKSVSLTNVSFLNKAQEYLRGDFLRFNRRRSYIFS